MATNEPNKPNNVINIDPGKTQTQEKSAPDQPLAAGGEAPAPAVEGSEKAKPTVPEKSAPEEKSPAKIPEPPRKSGPEVTAGKDSHMTEKKEQQEQDAKKPGRKPRTAKTADKPDKPEKAAKPAKRGRPPKADKEQKQAAGIGGGGSFGKTAPAKSEAPAAPLQPEQPPVPREAPRPKEPEQIVHINLSEIHAFKDHPFGVRNDAEMQALSESVKDKGVNSPALVRPREGGGYEIVAGHRRQWASELAGFKDMPCIVRQMTDDEAILAMTDDNLRQREKILPSEKAVSLKMQFEALKHQGTVGASGQNVPKKDAGKWSIDLVGERNGMTGKQVQRYIRLTELVPDLLKAADEKKLGFTPAIELSFIKPKNQNLIAVSIEGQQSSPSLSQAKRMRELDQKGQLNGDAIDGILCEQKKEVDRVIISSEELNKYFGKDKTPQQMKNQIIKLLDEWQGKEKEQAPPEKKADREK